jgi:hypothetical protein
MSLSNGAQRFFSVEEPLARYTYSLYEICRTANLNS